jgi:hypothetical protein
MTPINVSRPLIGEDAAEQDDRLAGHGESDERR